MKKILFLILTLALSLFIIIKSVTYFKSIEKKVNSIINSENKKELVLDNFKTSNTSLIYFDFFNSCDLE